VNPVRIIVIGATGRMGGCILRLASRDARFEIAAAVTERGHEALGRDVGAFHSFGNLGVALSDHCDAAADVAVDFSMPAGFRGWLADCTERGIPFISGTTGISDADRAALSKAATRIPVLWAANMSVGANLLMRMAAMAAAALGAAYDIEISEAHHRGKKDAPSGTALAIAHAIVRGEAHTRALRIVTGRAGETGPRAAEEIGIHAIRMGDTVGEHEVHFAADGELITLRHRATSRDTFAAGALRAAAWIVGRPPGLYQMADVLAG
jgi:4-hydroxy-tetrahydrodipicolinate reductase